MSRGRVWIPEYGTESKHHKICTKKKNRESDSGRISKKRLCSPSMKKTVIFYKMDYVSINIEVERTEWFMPQVKSVNFLTPRFSYKTLSHVKQLVLKNHNIVKKY